MYALLSFVLLLPNLLADIYVTEKDGVRSISTHKTPGARLLYQSRERSSPKGRRGSKGKHLPPPKDRIKAYQGFVQAAAEHYQLPTALIWAVMKVESNFHPSVVSHKGAMGLMQLMPNTASDMGVEDAFDPRQNILGGARLLRILANRFQGDLVLTLSGYHAGGGAVSSAGGIPYSQTAEYVRRVLNAYYRFQKKAPEAR